MKLQNIIKAIQTSQVRISDHAREEAKADSFLLNEIFFSVYNGEIIEDYPGDKPYPSCLIYGSTESGKFVHSVWAYNSEIQKAVLITVYEPDPKRWIDLKKRKTA
ncbi:MAG: hypothetical protein B6245_22490 [Desulfobacteraceae bacterium 4572_88]|nr:MAG: hypothetical protein B6245_22490 [Desulfobacteraceae bacterium 4572_88]RLC12931.1 MAG: hypothetical protein DRI57_17205 [Deltaproteobacteria bacterium]